MKYVNGVGVKTVASEWAIYFDMALTMLEEIRYHNERGERTVMIVPVGPTNQYPILAEMVNRLGVSLKNVHFFNMDEYLSSATEIIPKDHPLSFHRRMEDEFYSRVDPDLVMPPEQRRFPLPGEEAAFDALLESLGGADLCLGGLGINGHVAFNEAAEADDPITADEFAALPTRVLSISRETRTINAYGYQRGDLRGMPELCVTVGMKQILSSKKIYIVLNRPWQNGPLKHALHLAETPTLPATLLRRNENLTFCTTAEIAEGAL